MELLLIELGLTSKVIERNYVLSKRKRCSSKLNAA